MSPQAGTAFVDHVAKMLGLKVDLAGDISEQLAAAEDAEWREPAAAERAFEEISRAEDACAPSASRVPSRVFGGAPSRPPLSGRHSRTQDKNQRPPCTQAGGLAHTRRRTRLEGRRVAGSNAKREGGGGRLRRGSRSTGSR